MSHALLRQVIGATLAALALTTSAQNLQVAPGSDAGGAPPLHREQRRDDDDGDRYDPAFQRGRGNAQPLHRAEH